MTSWIEECRSEHEKCRKSMANKLLDETSSLIPADGILDLGEHNDQCIHLVLADGVTGKYCTLSHCWGPIDKRPVCVTRQNQNQYCQGFDTTELPKTFLDAIFITRKLSIRYLWIDSLCIVQDSQEYWRRESARMGSIYERAYLRLAAEGSSDSTRGLFEDEPDCPSRRPCINGNIEIPVLSDGIITADILNICPEIRSTKVCPRMRPQLPKERFPLHARAWEFQEMRLARRTVSFRRPGLVWKCKEAFWDERGHRLGEGGVIGATHARLWEDFLMDYTQRDLTYETDRLIALEGLARKYFKDGLRYYHYGIFLEPYRYGILPENPPWHLLWRRDVCDPNAGMRGLPELPSWSWAAKPGHKR